MHFQATLISILPLVFLNTATGRPIERGEKIFKFEIDSGPNTAYQPTTPDFIPSGQGKQGRMRGEGADPFGWPKDDIGTEDGISYFKFFTFKKNDDFNNQDPVDTFDCTLEAKKWSSWTHSYKLQAKADDWLASTKKDDHAHLYCYRAGESKGDRPIDTDGLDD